MSCQACTKSYGFFTKESGCPNCGFSFCTKCLKKDIEVPRCNGMKLKVCPRCFEKLESQQKAEQLLPGVQKFTLSQISSVPGNTIFDVEDPSSEDLGPVLQPVQPNIKPEQEDDIISKNLDSVLSKRLQNLKSEDNKNLPTDEDISTRLADLKGTPQKNYNYSDLLVSKDHRTEKEKIDDLLKQFVDETAIDSNASRPSSNPIDEIEKRLAALRGTEYKRNDTTPSDNENEVEDDDEAASKIVNRFLEEVNLPNVPVDEHEREFFASLPKPSEATEELPWCTICNEDALIRCKGCDGELFCKTCFKEVHDDEEYKNHSTESYSAPPKFKENHF